LMAVPQGEVEIGSEDGSSDESPAHTVYIDAFWIDRTEVTNVMFGKCVAEGACTPPAKTSSETNPEYFGNPEFDDYPVIFVDWDQANTYCQWAGRRLPTEAEWEKAARGTDGRTYPWGREIICSYANFSDCKSDTEKVGSYVAGISPSGALDMAGNVWEWVADWYEKNFYGVSPNHNPQGPPSGTFRVLRGGSWGSNENVVRSSSRGRDDPGYTSKRGGFRCALSP